MTRCKHFPNLTGLLSALVLGFCSLCVNADSSSSGKTAGPTVFIDDRNPTQGLNEIQDFLYFVPLISPVLVECTLSEKNSQKIKFLTSTVEEDADSFHAVCTFQITGKGSYISRFESASLIARKIRKIGRGNTFKNLVDYIKMDGAGYGKFIISGRRRNGKMLVNKVEVRFDDRDHKSPVSVGLYSVKPENNVYSYEKRFDIQTARINALIFKREKNSPKMEVVVDSVGGEQASDSIWGVMKGIIANMLIDPIQIDAGGNAAVLEFCQAIVRQQSAYTFPLAQKLK